MDSLFTPEVIEQFIALLTTAADKGGTAVIIWLALPAVLALISSIAWVWCIIYIVKSAKTWLVKLTDNAIESERIRKQPVETIYKANGMFISKEVGDDLAELLRREYCTEGSRYFHDSDLTKLRKLHERARHPEKDSGLA